MKKALSAILGTAVLLGTVGTLPAGTDTGGTGLITAVSAAVEDPTASDSLLSYQDFESSAANWTNRGTADVALSAKAAYKGSGSLFVSGRSDSWAGAGMMLGTGKYTAGSAYSFSVAVRYDTGSATTKFHFTLQYTDAAGKTAYEKLVSVDVPKGQWVQLANPSFTIPSGAEDLLIYVETDTGTSDFYLDEAFIMEDGYEISGPKAVIRSLGDLDGDGCVSAADLSIAKEGLLNGFSDDTVKKFADVNYDKEVNVADIVWFYKFILGEVSEFPERVITEPESQPMRLMSEYTPEVAANVVNMEPNDSHNEKPGVQYGTVTKKTYYSAKAKREKAYNILLPAGYDESKEYPVLYVLHGYYEKEDRMIIQGNGKMYTRQIIGNLIAEGKAEDMIVVFPYVFTSDTMAECTGMNDANNQAYDNFVDDIVDSLMPHIEENYSVKTGRENTAVTGFSMGGRESLLIGMKYADKFGYVGAICPAPGVTGAFKWNSEEEAPSLLFITAGSNDEVVYTTPNGYHESFTKNNVPHVWHYCQGGYHGDNSIQAHLYNFVQAIFKA